MIILEAAIDGGSITVWDKGSKTDDKFKVFEDLGQGRLVDV